MQPFKFVLKSILFAVALIGGIGHAAAGAVGEIGAHLATERTEQTSGATSERHFRVNLAAGWSSAIDADHSLGYGASFRTERGLQSGSEIAGYGLGAFVAWYYGALSLRFDYIFLAEQKANNGVVETEFSDGGGFAFEARWLHWFDGAKVALGPSLAFQQMKYAKSRVGSLPETNSSRTVESLTPGITAIFLF